jgi:hypothetical protein
MRIPGALMKNIFFLGVIIFCSCNESKQKEEPAAEERAFRQRYVDSVTAELTESAINKAYFDTANEVNSPVKILSFKVIRSESGNYRNVYLQYTNTSSKTIMLFVSGGMV